MEITLKGKVAIITGSIQGIGLRTAQMLADAGAAVVINNHTDQEELEKQAQAIRDAGGQVKAVTADITDRKQAGKLIQAAEELGAGPDILVNNAGGLIARVPTAEFDDDHFATVVDVNLKTAMLMSHLVLPYMKKQGAGKIINFSSQAAHDGGGPGAGAYAAAKAAIWTFTKSLAKEVGPDGITSNCVAPGFIASTAFHNVFTSPEVHEKVKEMVPLKRLGTVDDVAKVILFLASPLSDYINGQIIEVNGGLYML
ncbi:MAG: glucose 1-dehydrogenase [Fidelibacterota bacterium]|nr:MAG: glucose 1-dehydrogenase [Candidatus Neomarinimicrobiota bacterium]